MNNYNSPIEYLHHLDVSNIEGVRFFKNNEESYSIFLDSIKKIALYVVEKYGKTQFAPGELDIEKDYFIENFQSSLSSEDYTLLVSTLRGWIESGGYFEIIYSGAIKQKTGDISIRGKINNFLGYIPFGGIGVKTFFGYSFILYLSVLMLKISWLHIGEHNFSQELDFILYIGLFYLFLRRWKGGKFHNIKIYCLYFGFGVILLYLILMNSKAFFEIGLIVVSSPVVLVFGGKIGLIESILGSPHPMWMLITLFSIISFEIMTCLIVISPRKNK